MLFTSKEWPIKVLIKVRVVKASEEKLQSLIVELIKIQKIVEKRRI
jgi:hypothetical protein